MTNALSSENLLRHIRALSVDIGPRPATSSAERAAADYIYGQLAQLNIDPIKRQPFRTIPRLSYKVGPGFLLIAASLLIGLRKGRFWQIAGGLAASISGLILPAIWRLSPMVWESILPNGESQNVIAKISPRRGRHHKIVIMSHIDTSYHRLSAAPPLVGIFPRIADATVISAVVTGLLSVAGLFRPIRLLGALGLLGGVGTLVADESAGGIPGANDNASGIAVSLALAEHLEHEPLENTEVWFVYTGAEQASLRGSHSLLEKYGNSLSDALFINLKMVGKGELCWVTQQGIGVFSQYQPRYGLVPIAERVAAARPELGVMGKPMLLIDDLSAIMDWGFSGITIAGYDRLTGHPPNLHRNTDTLETLDPETLDRAAQFVLEMIHQIDSSDALA